MVKVATFKTMNSQGVKWKDISDLHFQTGITQTGVCIGLFWRICRVKLEQVHCRYLLCLQVKMHNGCVSDLTGNDTQLKNVLRCSAVRKKSTCERNSIKPTWAWHHQHTVTLVVRWSGLTNFFKQVFHKQVHAYDFFEGFARSRRSKFTGAIFFVCK